MADDLNVNGNFYEIHNTIEDFKTDPAGDMVSFWEEISVTKTEIKEERYDFEMPVEDVILANVKEELGYSPEIVFEEEELGVVRKVKRLLNGNLDSGNRKFREERPQELFKCIYKNCKCPDLQEESCECDICGYTTVYKHNLKSHISIKHSSAPKNYKCIHCKYAARTKQHLDAHLCSHVNDKPFKCTYKSCKCTPGQEEVCECGTCGYASVFRINLKRHILAKHSTEPKRYKCKECKYATHMKVDLTRHIRSHTNEKPFKCTYKNCNCTPEQKESCKCNMCEYAGTIKSNLNKHVLVRHSAKPKSYRCKECTYTTHSKRSLVLHTRTHTNKRPHKCTYKNCKCIPGQKEACECSMCEFAATRKHDLKRHIKIKHSEAPKK